MPKNYENLKEYKDSWYSLTPNRLIVTLGVLKEEVNCDVCIVGAGFTGLSAAIELAEKGLSVVVLESQTVGGGASGRNSGYICRGLGQTPGYMIERFGLAEARFMAHLSLEGLGLMLERINSHKIDCDLKFGHLTAGLRPRHVGQLQQTLRDWGKLGHEDLDYIDKRGMDKMVGSDRYSSGLFDPKGAHFHPLNYALGLAHATQRQGVKIYDTTNVFEIVPGNSPTIITAQGTVRAKFVILTGVSGIKGTESMGHKTLAASAYMLSSEPISETRARNMLPKNIVVSHIGDFPHYYSLSTDNRLLFGGNINHRNSNFAAADAALRARMLQVFPGMKMTLTQHCWSVPLSLTRNRLPHLGRMGGNIYFAHGFGASGVIATNIIGKILGEAVSGQAGRFDVFARLRHASFPGGTLLQHPLFALGRAWYNLREMI